MNSNFEQALSDLEVQLEAAAKAAKTAAALLKKAQGSAKTGQLRDLNRSLVEARNASKQFADAMAAADSSWTFEAEPYFASGEYLNELKAEADRAGLKLFDKDQSIYCFPMLLRLSEKDATVLIDRKPERKIRPRELVKILLARQKLPQRFNEGKLLETLFEAYMHLTPHKNAAGRGEVVSLIKIHQLLTLLPGSDREYPKEEFARDMYLLDRQPDLLTREGYRFALPASTATKGGGPRLVVIDEQGGERVYAGIRFDKE